MISSRPFNLRMIRVRVAQAKVTIGYQHRRYTSKLTARIGHIKMIAICDWTNPVLAMHCSAEWGKERYEPLSGGNWPPAWMKFLKDEAERLNEPSASVGVLVTSDR
jgi:hypothetical protein